MEETDLSVLFGNLLENALDACETEQKALWERKKVQSGTTSMQDTENVQKEGTDEQIMQFEQNRQRVKVVINASQKGQALCVTVDNTLDVYKRQTLMWSLMKDIARDLGVRTDVPFRELTPKEREIVFPPILR